MSLFGDPDHFDITGQDIYDYRTRRHIKLLLRRQKQKLEADQIDKLLTLQLSNINVTIQNRDQEAYVNARNTYLQLLDLYTECTSCGFLTKLAAEKKKKPTFDGKYWQDKWEKHFGLDARTLRPLSKKRREELEQKELQ